MITYFLVKSGGIRQRPFRKIYFMYEALPVLWKINTLLVNQQQRPSPVNQNVEGRICYCRRASRLCSVIDLMKRNGNPFVSSQSGFGVKIEAHYDKYITSPRRKRIQSNWRRFALLNVLDPGIPISHPTK